MGHCAPPDIFIPVHPRHFGCLERCVESVRQNIQPSGGKICIVTAALPIDLRQRLDRLDCSYLHEADVVSVDAASLPGGSAMLAQLLKWEARRFSSTPTFLVIDAGTVIRSTTSLFCESQPVVLCENRFRFGWLMCFNYFFGQIPMPTAPVSGELSHFDVAVLEEMIGKIQGRWNAPWMQAAIAIVRQVAGTAFDAADIFGHYLRLFYPDRFVASEALEAEEKTELAEPIVRMGTLGYNGRFANQIFQYAFLQAYAKRHGMRAECPPWIGCSLFGHQTELNATTLPVFREDKGDADEMIRLDLQKEYGSFELWGYFQHPRHWADDKETFRNLFVPLPFLKKPLDDAISRIKGGRKTLIAIHLRRGDFNGGPVFWPAPEEWYLKWLAEIWDTVIDPVLFIATDDAANVLAKFSAYHPKTAADLQVNVNGAEFYSDFYVLSQCDVLGISNSTFSFAAAMLNRTASHFARPEPNLEKMIAFDPWTSEVQLRKQEPTLLAA